MRITRTPIQVNDRLLDEITDHAIQVLQVANAVRPEVFMVGGNPVRLMTRDAGGNPQWEAMTPDRMRNHLAHLADWVNVLTKADGSQTIKPSKPPLDVVKNLLAETTLPLPVVDRLVTTPIFTADGTLVAEAGYSNLGRVYLQPTVQVPPVPNQPTKEVVAFAKKLLLEELLGDFPFVSVADRNHAVAALLLPVVRDIIDGPTPFHLISATAKGSGKTLLASTILHINTGTVSLLPDTRNRDEIRKRIVASLATGTSVLALDNLSGHLNSSALASILTAPVVDDRELGYTRMLRLSNRVLWLGTSNGITMSDELRRRTVPIQLDAHMEEPHTRRPSDFRYPDLMGWVKDRRRHLVWALLVLVRHWQAVGSPMGTPSLGSFECWALVLGGILEAAGIPGFLTNIKEWSASGADPVTEGWRLFGQAWYGKYASVHVKVGDLLSVYDGIGDDFLDLGWSDAARNSKLGKELTAKRGAVIGAYTITIPATKQGSKVYSLIPHQESGS